MEPVNRSTFVTAVAWVFIVLGGFATFIAALQNVMVFLLFPDSGMPSSFESDVASGNVPAIASFMLRNLELAFVGIFMISLVTLVSAIGLLRRRNWARLVFIGVMVLGIVWNLGGIAVQQMFMSAFPPTPNAPPAFEIRFETMHTIMRVASAVVALVFSALFGWIAWRLCSADIRREFGRAGNTDNGELRADEYR